MNFSKPFGSSATETSEVEVEGNIRELSRGSVVFRQGENGDSETSVTELGSLLRRVSGNSRREIDTLIGELQTLREKLETDSRRLQNDISEYALPSCLQVHYAGQRGRSGLSSIVLKAAPGSSSK